MAHFFRHEHGRLTAVLVAKYGAHRLELVEDAVQAALLSALSAWTKQGTPQAPGAWLYTAAHNAMRDALRRAKTHSKHEDALAAALAEPPALEPSRLPGEVQDDMLRMLFVCADPRLPEESRLVLALKTLCGFGTGEIALRLFLTEANVHKRLARARDKLRELCIDIDSVATADLAPRLGSVHTMLYVLFNEGYQSAQSDMVIRRELCEEAMRLGALVASHENTAGSESSALLSLMLFHAARLDARVDAVGDLVLFEDQDRALWDRALIAEAFSWLSRSEVAPGEPLGRFRLEAAIAAEYCMPAAFADTDWLSISSMYAALERVHPSPMYRLSRAVAVAYAESPHAGLALLADFVVPGWIARFYLWDSVLGELYRRAGDVARARIYLERALQSAPTDAERRLIQARFATL